MSHKLQTRLISGLLVFVMVFAAVVGAGLAINYDFGEMFSGLGFGFGSNSGSNMTAINTTNPGSFITANGTYGYEITASANKLTVDGDRDAAYTASGLKVSASYLMPASNSTFDVYFAADDENLYVLYEFSKVEPIYYNASYSGKHHFDLAEFHLDLNAGMTSGQVFQINGGIAGSEDSATKPNIIDNSLGVTDYTVKHTGLGGYGYNVEFAIPLSRVSGTYNGAKAVSFTALSTISTKYDGTSTAPTRSYTFAGNVWTDSHPGSTDANTPKNYPSTLVIKESPLQFTTSAGNVGNYVIKSETPIALDGVRDSVYDTNGIKKLTAVYGTGRGGFDFYAAADDEYVYFFYEITKTSSSKLYYYDEYPGYKSQWHFDGADFILGLNGKEGSGDKVEFHMNARHEGYGKNPATGATGTAVSYDGAIASNKLDNFYVKHVTTPGQGSSVKYTIEARVRYRSLSSPGGFP